MASLCRVGGVVVKQDDARRPGVLADHKRQGKRLIPPFVHLLGPLKEVSWINTMIPELCWIAMLRSEHGDAQGVEFVTAMARAARALGLAPPRIFGAASSYARLSPDQWHQVREDLASGKKLLQIQRALRPLVALYPECPLAGLFEPNADVLPEADLSIVKRVVADLFSREARSPMLTQAVFVWLAFDAEVLKVQEGLALAEFPEIERYPDTELSKRVGSGVRVAVNMFLADGDLYNPSPWPRYFWNRGIALSACELGDE